MTPKKQRELKAFNRLIKQVIKGVDVFQKTGRRTQFISIQDQLETFHKEYGDQHGKNRPNLPPTR